MQTSRKTNTQGQALVEFALILGILLLIIFVVIESAHLVQSQSDCAECGASQRSLRHFRGNLGICDRTSSSLSLPFRPLSVTPFAVKYDNLSS